MFTDLYDKCYFVIAEAMFVVVPALASMLSDWLLLCFMWQTAKDVRALHLFDVFNIDSFELDGIDRPPGQSRRIKSCICWDN